MNKPAKEVVSVSAAEAMRNIELELRVAEVGALRLRLWLAAKLIKLAGFVIGCKIRIVQSSEFDDLPLLHRTRSYMRLGDYEIPRQCSVKSSSPLYESSFSVWGPSVDFFLNGVKQDRIVSYDLDAGYVRVQKLGPDGQLFIAGDEVVTEVRYGTIEPRLIIR